MRNLFLIIFFCIVSLGFAQEKAVKADILVQALLSGKKMDFTSTVFYNPVNNKLVQHFLTPKEYYVISNNKGEGQIYLPDSNMVKLKAGEEMNSERSTFGVFMGNAKRDLGLSDLGYGIQNVRYENQYEVSEWRKIYDTETSPVDKIELVHENFKPIYMAYFNTENMIIKKVFYYDYKGFGNYDIPGKITEITFLNESDSIVQRTSILNLEFIGNDNAELNFKIPENAKVSE